MTALIIAMVIAIPVVLFPAALIWYINAGGLFMAVTEARAAREKKLATAKAVK
jgi:hypothetical protein